MSFIRKNNVNDTSNRFQGVFVETRFMSFYVKIPNKTICQKSCQNDDKNTRFVPKNNVKPLFCYLVGYTREMIEKWVSEALMNSQVIVHIDFR